MRKSNRPACAIATAEFRLLGAAGRALLALHVYGLVWLVGDRRALRESTCRFERGAVTLRKPTVVRGPYGVRRRAKSVGLYVDDPVAFLALLRRAAAGSVPV